MDHFKFYGSATIGTKGQIVVPAEAREELKMTEGEKVVILKSPHHSGLLVLKAEFLEHHLNDVQSKLNNLKESPSE